MDFIRVAFKENKDGTREFYPALLAIESQDLVIRGGQFVAIWDEDTKLYSKQQSHIPDIIDRAFTKMVANDIRSGDIVKKVRNFDNQLYNRVLSLIRSIGDIGPELDQRLVFADEEPMKEYAATFKMPYSLSDAPAEVWNKVCNKLYAPDQRKKFEWAIGSILTGDSAFNIQKFYVFFGPPGSGKSTIMNIIEMVFAGHTAGFSAYDMGKADAAFALEPFARNPLVAIDQDSDLSRLELNTNLNRIVSHDRVMINSKGKNIFPIIPRTTLFIGTNEPVKIKDRKSGLFRRLVDIQPSGDIFEEEEYHQLMDQVQYEIGSIAHHCIGVYMDHGRTFLSSYRSTDMMYRTNDIFNFVEDERLVLKNGVSLKQAHRMYTTWCEETGTRNVYKQFQFRDLLKDYFHEFHPEIMINGERHRSYFKELRILEQFSWKGLAPAPPRGWLELDMKVSLLDDVLMGLPAQEASVSGTPKQAWENVTTLLKDIDTSVEHFVKVPTQHIVIDFDLRDENGAKSLARNLDAASRWPPTYAEVSRGGGGLHLHYDYDGDVERLANASPEGGYEVKTLLGGASLRRRLSLCNTHKVATISSGLPLKEEKVLPAEIRMTEKGLRDLIHRCLQKGIHPGTKSNMDMIEQVLKDAETQGLKYDVSDMFDDILAFAMGSSHQRQVSLEIANRLKLSSEEEEFEVAEDDLEAPLAYFDCEVYPNLFAIGYMYDDDDAEVVKLLNPTAEEVAALFKLRLVGFFNRGYDNHILWAASLGWTNKALYDLSQRIIAENDRRAGFGPAYNVAYGDAYDIIVEKHSLKWWEIELGLPHKEMDLPWDQDVPEDRVLDVLDYLENDVRATRAVAKHRDQDFKAREILASLSGLAVCNTNRQHTEKLIFGDLPYDAKPELVYTDLREMFPGYEFDQFKPGKEKSTYKGIMVGEGGWVDSDPGMYEDVAVLDISSMHPTSIVELNLFGKYTAEFKKLLDIRLAIKRGDYDTAIDLDERLVPYLTDAHEGYNPAKARALSDALKIVINSVYGLTAASFPNKFKDPRNIDNIVAKRGALFMVDLKEFIESEGYSVVHVKTDSVKIPGANLEIIDKVMEFARKYGYTFEHEDTYQKFCLVNDAVYVNYSNKHQQWEATGAQFQHPVVFKTLFSKEEISERDYVEVKQVAKGAMYLVQDDSSVKQFVGRFGAFVPVLQGRTLMRIDGDKEHAVAGTKGFLWEIDEVALANHMEVDTAYFDKLIDAGKQTIEKFGSWAEFTRIK